MTPYPYLLETTIAHLERERMEQAARYRLLRDVRRVSAGIRERL